MNLTQSIISKAIEETYSENADKEAFSFIIDPK